MPGSPDALEMSDRTPSFRWPLFFNVSGTYAWTPTRVATRGPSVPFARLDSFEDGAADLDFSDSDSTQRFWPIWLSRETVRFDVDGRYPQMTVSGEVQSGYAGRLHWIAELSRTGWSSWEGPIWYRNGTGHLMPFNHVAVTAARSLYPSQRTLTIEFTGGTGVRRTRTYRWDSAYFGDVEFEYDSTADANPVIEISTCDHPNRPASMACEELSLEDVYRRAGFKTSRSGGGTSSLTGAGSNGRWSDAEMHDAMVTYWSRFGDRANWSLWVLWAALHDSGTSLGGVMFDDIGPNHRQGTAIFSESFISNPPAGDPNPAAWVARMRLWTAAHEMGHAFNLAHSWQKQHPSSWGSSWIPLANEPEVRSFMNYPYNVSGGEPAFFADFDYRFSDQELLFMRHAPRRFVQMGNSEWFDDHGFEQVEALSNGLRLEVRANRAECVFDFLEPVNLELKLVNDGPRTILIDDEVMVEGKDLTVIVKRDTQPATQWTPYAEYVRSETPSPLAPGEARYVPLAVSAGLNGNACAEPGHYSVQIALHTTDGTVVSNTFRLRVRTPRSWDEEDIAGDFFTDEVSRAVALGGTRAMTAANTTLENVVDRLPESRVAMHASVALEMRRLQTFKYLDVVTDPESPSLGAEAATIESAATALTAALITPGGGAADSFGHVQLNQQVSHLAAALDADGDSEQAAECEHGLLRALGDRGVKQQVLDDIASRERSYRPHTK